MKCRTSWEDGGHIFFLEGGSICFCMCSRQHPKYPQLGLHGWQCHDTGRYRRSGIAGLNLWNCLTEVISFFPVPTILWALSFCITFVGHYASEYAQDAMCHAILQLCVKVAIVATTNSATILWVLCCHTDGLYNPLYMGVTNRSTGESLISFYKSFYVTQITFIPCLPHRTKPTNQSWVHPNCQRPASCYLVRIKR